MFSSRVFAEPELEFGDGGRHQDPRVGLMEHGPLQPILGDCIRIGVIGTAETTDGFVQFIERCKTGIERKESPLINLFPPFPGIGNQNPFRCSFEVEAEARRVIPKRDIDRLVALSRQSEVVTSSVEAFVDEARALLESSSRPDVIVLALPVDLIIKVVNAGFSTDDDEDDDANLNFRDYLKARMLSLKVPTQIVWPHLWDDGAKIPRKLKNTLRQSQDPATRAWNLLNALFYKAGRVPWRLPKAESEYKSSYLGIGFYKDLSGQRLLTSTAQMFDERGRGLILRGARARTDKGDRHPSLHIRPRRSRLAPPLRRRRKAHRSA